MLVYDITNEKSFDNIKNWIRNIEEVSVIAYYSFLKFISPTLFYNNYSNFVQKNVYCSVTLNSVACEDTKL